MTDLLYILGGFVGLLIGGELLVRGAVALAQRLGISPLVIGLTLVGFGTSMPELVTSVQAALAGAPGIAVGNVVGSNIANILLILGLAAALSPVAVDPAAFRRDGPALALATLAALGVVLWGEAGRLLGAAGILLLAAYVWGTLRAERSRGPAAAVYEHEAAAMTAPRHRPVWIEALRLLGGIAITILAARYLVLGAVSVAEGLGVSETVIGLTVVAIGTSLPELVTSVIAARKGESDVALGNVLGSNLFNILGILGATALISPLAVPPEIARLDIWVMLAATAALIWVAMSGWRVTRAEGLAMLAAYAAYLGLLVVLA